MAVIGELKKISTRLKRGMNFDVTQILKATSDEDDMGRGTGYRW